ncbi:hypothetical protein TTHERM_001081738 (macronuclear) [Tetrahymena thermophila SB210]|uniref:AMP-binding enzyme family protein n=1 Tax=Tetrahymena thermophila (strain SB210) TaxID=312017 RepID=W7XC94_TETTS|nr:hypothetical protein TTHERM_001081738 [Tetrahymena thermophila SB210]EWS74153.1 hypothetical protein TTHERM_001081738 [Tetrahymena thermophila SB210]|eukprot:XP_012653313.1 hypothetical protein TTHERM_001081738 [Tetrahymena thermophila SB210]
MPLSNDFFGFQLAPQFNQDLITQQYSQNKTFIVFLAFYFYRNSSYNGYQQLDVVNCKNPQLNGYYCVDYSKNPYLNIKIGNKNNVFSELIIFSYRCQDTDIYKTFVPDNCADPSEIDKYLANTQNTLNFRLQISQYNTTSKEVEIGYINNRLASLGNYLTLAELKVKKQITSIKEGLFLQSESSFSSPISVQFGSSSLDYKSYVRETGKKMISLVTVDVDENVQYFNIEYPPFTEILALCNSFFALLMILGVICRAIAQRLIRQDIFLLVLQNSYQETYQKILKNRNIAQFNEDILLNQVDKSLLTANEGIENNQQILIPQFKHLSSQSVFRKGQSYDSKQSCSKQHNQLLQDNQVSISNVLFQPHQELSQVFTKPNKQSPPLKSYQSYSLKKDNSYQSNLSLCQTSQKNEITRSIYLKSHNKNSKQDETNNQSRTKNDCNFNQIINQRLTAFSNQKVNEKVKNQLFKIRLFCKNKFLESCGLNKQMMDKIEKQVFESLDFYKLYKDIQLLKKAMMMLLSKDQFAALQLVGYSHEFLGLKLDKQTKATIENIENQKSHLEQQNIIQQSEELQSQQIGLFLQRYQSQQNLSQVDKRIFSSMFINSIL